ncbi:MAG: LD-carboxypeptidase [Flavobacteriales bacterium]|nr:LD-carboxypeptidase [Flavobacteriales bacterium]
MVIIPPSLRPGDTIAIIPTARAISRDELRDGIALAESWGLRVKLGAGIGRRHFQQAGIDAERAADLQAAIEDPAVRAIWCARGGYGTIRIMDRVDLSPLKRNPKWVIGFSDITVLHNALHGLGVASLHAQMPFAIGIKTEECRESLRRVLFGGEYRVVSGEWRVDSARPATHHSPLDTQRAGQCEGVLVGGNLSILYALRGTPFDIDPKGKVLFLEDLDELRYHVDRMVQNLKHGGWFKELAGLIVGGMSGMRDKDDKDPFGMEAEAMIAEAVAPYGYPVCFGFPAGHVADNRALIMGAKAKLSVTPMGATLSYA